MPKNESRFKKVSYPHNDYQRAFKVLRVLSKWSPATPSTISKLMIEGTKYSTAAVRSSLINLKAHGYCTESKTDKTSMWNITLKGRLVLLVIEKQNIIMIAEENKHNRIMKMVHALLQNNRKLLVQMLIERLEKSYDIGKNPEEVAKEWYFETKQFILKDYVDQKKYPDLHSYKMELENEEMIINILKAKGKSNVIEYNYHNFS